MIDVYKPTYLTGTSAEERRTVAKHVLVDLFNYWREMGLQFTPVEISIRTKVFVIDTDIGRYTDSTTGTGVLDSEQLASSSRCFNCHCRWQIEEK